MGFQGTQTAYGFGGVGAGKGKVHAHAANMPPLPQKEPAHLQQQDSSDEDSNGDEEENEEEAPEEEQGDGEWKPGQKKKHDDLRLVMDKKHAKRKRGRSKKPKKDDE